LNHGFEVFNGCGGSSIACINANGSGISESTTLTNLIVGNTYFVRVFTATSSLTVSNFSICIFGSVQSTCIPQVSIASSSTTICQGTSLTFEATPTFGGNNPSYQWRVNSNNVGTNSATFTTSSLNNGDQVSCVMTSNAACATPTTATSDVISVVVNSLPAVSITFAGGVLTATPGYSNYQWSLNGVLIPDQITNSFTPTQTGVYDVAVLDGNNCSNSANFNLTSLVSESFNQLKISVVPNPLKDFVRVISPSPIKKVTLIDMSGRILFTSVIHHDTIDLSMLQSGNYFMNLETSLGSDIIKIIKE
jgi:hypothetical protein